ncbi:hypothetical protein [Nitrospira sp. BLG_2]|uniref:hypothetical protein n=1 Tax=Nitrospira sp. BLG_2 TaxID=3397507 RepID=UPI003B9CE46E
MFTYRDIKMILDQMKPEHLDQPAQVFMSQPDGDKPVPLCPVIGFHTIEYFVAGSETGEECQKTRSSEDNEHHPEHYVFLADENPFAEDGAIAYDLMTGEAIYGKNKKKEVENNEFHDTFPE